MSVGVCMLFFSYLSQKRNKKKIKIKAQKVTFSEQKPMRLDRVTNGEKMSCVLVLSEIFKINY